MRFESKKISIFLLATCTSLFACNKDDCKSWYYYKETKCSDACGTGENDNGDEVKEAVSAYLHSNGISITEIEVAEKELDEGCESCHCKTGRHIRGRHIRVRANEQYFSKLESMGFKNE